MSTSFKITNKSPTSVESERKSEKLNVLTTKKIKCDVKLIELKKKKQKHCVEDSSDEEEYTGRGEIVTMKSLGFKITKKKMKKLKRLKQKSDNTTKWKTKAGSFKTSKTCKINFSLPGFHPGREIQWKAYVEDTPLEDSQYDIIIGRDLLHELGIDL